MRKFKIWQHRFAFSKSYCLYIVMECNDNNGLVSHYSKAFIMFLAWDTIDRMFSWQSDYYLNIAYVDVNYSVGGRLFISERSLDQLPNTQQNIYNTLKVPQLCLNSAVYPSYVYTHVLYTHLIAFKLHKTRCDTKKSRESLMKLCYHFT